MKNHRIVLTSCYLLPRAVALVVLMIIVGCDTSRDGEDVAPPTQPAPTDGVTDDARPDYTDRVTSSEVQPGDRDLSVADRSGEASSNAQFSLGGPATARIMSTGQGNAEGTVTFSAAEDGDGMLVEVDLEGLEPGVHGFHVHAVGDCSADDASSAGGHFNPYNTLHGSPEDGEHHVGDMGNIEADDDGRVATELTFRGLAFSGPASILQKAVLIHSNEDDMESQPAGDAGDPVGCGVIRIDNTVLAQ